MPYRTIGIEYNLPLGIFTTRYKFDAFAFYIDFFMTYALKNYIGTVLECGMAPYFKICIKL
jgi:hypothetical protein